MMLITIKSKLSRFVISCFMLRSKEIQIKGYDQRMIKILCDEETRKGGYAFRQRESDLSRGHRRDRRQKQ